MIFLVLDCSEKMDGKPKSPMARGDMDERKLLGQRIKDLRKLRGYTQEQLAEIIDINPKYLSSVERGEENPTLDLFLRLVQGLEVELLDLFRFVHEETNPKALRKSLDQLLSSANVEQLQIAYKLLRTLMT